MLWAFKKIIIKIFFLIYFLPNDKSNLSLSLFFNINNEHVQYGSEVSVCFKNVYVGAVFIGLIGQLDLSPQIIRL